MKIKKKRKYLIAFIAIFFVVVVFVLTFALRRLEDLVDTEDTVIIKNNKVSEPKYESDHNSDSYNNRKLPSENEEGNLTEEKYNTNNETIEGQKKYGNERFRIPEEEL